ncbi:LytR/AlgR family response regulator transcription factor [Dethiothermospora halolimnae]|uniref:LytR/AlgR family response regulator transcription factor n=1 Tax=Dethiothermospora halolimnae TaxID=3114390 RepID=UPI003CCBC8A5
MELNIVICDDEPVQVGIISSFIDRMGLDAEINIIKTYSGEGLIETIKNKEVDIVFLDIEMKEMNGMEVGEYIRERNKDAIIVFITGYKDYAFNAFKIKAFDYIMKPITEKKFQNLMKEIIDKVNEKSYLKDIYNVFTLKKGEQYIKLNYDKIYFFEKVVHKIRVHTYDGEYETYGTIKGLKEQLDMDTFIQCHQGYIVNKTKIFEYSGKEIYIEDLDQYIPVSRRFNKKIRQVVLDNLFR